MIEFRNVSAGYGKKNIIKNVSFDIPKGKLISIIGPNGSGKSTLLKTAVGILKPNAGEILVEDKSTALMSGQETAKTIAYLAQGKGVSDMTVYQLVLHGRFPHLNYPRRYSAKDCEIAQRALKQLGIDSLANRTLSSLSGGMRQNAYIAMALAQDTDYILLDEPTTYLDISHQIELMRILRTLADGGKGIVAVMHDLPLAFSSSDSIVALKDGEIVAVGEPNRICKEGVVKDMLGIELQFCEGEHYYHYKYTI